MLPHHFISYSTGDGRELTERLERELRAGMPSFACWFGGLHIHAAVDWDWQINEAIKECETLLFVMTRQSVADISSCKEEWTKALAFKKPVIPLLFDDSVEPPFGLARRHYIDFVKDFSEGCEKLRNELTYLRTPAGQLLVLKFQLVDAQRDLDRAKSENARVRAQKDVTNLTATIADIEETLRRPQAAEARQEEIIALGLERERQPTLSRPPAAANRVRFVNQPPGDAPRYFQDRVVETALLVDFLKDRARRAITVVGRGGVGKTAVVCRLLDAVRAGHLPESEEPMAVDGIVYLSGAGSRRISFASIFEDLAQLLDQNAIKVLEAIYKSPNLTVSEKMGALLDRFPSGCYVLLLDNFEDLLDSGSVRDPDVEAALLRTLEHQPHGVKLIITTRERPSDFLLAAPGRQSVLDLDNGLESPFAEAVLRQMDRNGTLGLKDAPDALLDKVRERVRGYPRALEAFSAILAADRTATIEKLLREAKKLPENVVEALVGEAFSRLDHSAERVMQALAIYGQPVPVIAVDFLLRGHLPLADTAPILRRLVDMHFVRREGERYYLHPVDRDYALSRIPVGISRDRARQRREDKNAMAGSLRDGFTANAGGESEPPFTQSALLERAAEYFSQVRKPRAVWKSIQDLAPQLAEFDLRMQTHDFETALEILSDIKDPYLLHWGHYSLVQHMAEQLAGRLDEPRDELVRLMILAEAVMQGGEDRRAIDYWEQVKLIAEDLKDEKSRWHAVFTIASCYSSLGDHRRVIDAGRRLLQFVRRRGDLRQWEGTCHNQIGLAFRDLGKLRHALRHLRRSRAIAHEEGDEHGEEGDWHNVGMCLQDLGKIDEARQHYERALTFSEKTGDRKWRANHMGALGSCASDLGATADAEALYREAAQIRREIGDPYAIAGISTSVAACQARRNEIDAAMRQTLEALTIARRLGERDKEHVNLTSLAELQLDAGELDKARHTAVAAVEIGEQLRLPMAGTWHMLALTLLLGGDLAAARKAVENAMEHDLPRQKSRSAFLRGAIALREGDQVAARIAFDHALDYANALRLCTPKFLSALDDEALARCGLALCRSSRHLAEAVTVFHSARTVNSEPGVIARVLCLMDVLTPSDPSQLLLLARAAAAGE